MDGRYERLARNEALSRNLNEQIAAWSASQGLRAGEKIEFYCECGDSTCFERVHMTREEYEAVRTDSARFAVLPDRVKPEISRVVEEHDGYVVVKTAEDLRGIVEDMDARRAGTAHLQKPPRRDFPLARLVLRVARRRYGSILEAPLPQALRTTSSARTR